LGNGITLEMVAIPGGSFQMGSEESDDAKPIHPVTIAPFYMGKYAVTQAQWQAIAALPKINLDLNPDPARFKGANRPVEKVSWDESVEWCARLSQKTGKLYRLPTEAEWEYACRAGTTTPFYFGETISTDLANYDGNYTYGAGVKGEYRGQTTDVGSFPANAFGLYDLHGNVWEWCADHWHENYQGAPKDGSAWISSGNSENRLTRGGSWYIDPWDCRSAYRGYDSLVHRRGLLGFRLVCVLA
jgi:formylglycine-generating enzyme required for sulfatase activity